jgi:signal peptidase
MIGLKPHHHHLTLRITRKRFAAVDSSSCILKTIKESVVKKTAENFGLAVIVLIMAAAVAMFLAPIFGWRVDAVFSGSMEPELNVGGLVVTRPIDIENIKVGDTITFYSPINEKPVSHRVIAVEDGPSFSLRTKGDANENDDPFIVKAESLVGKVCFHIPYLGYITQFVKTPLGLLLTICLPGLILIAMEIKDIWHVFSIRIKEIWRVLSEEDEEDIEKNTA